MSSNSLAPSPPSGCQVHPDRRVSRSRGRAAEQPRSGRRGGGLGLHGRRGHVQPGHRPAGDVLRNETQRDRPLAEVEGTTTLCSWWIDDIDLMEHSQNVQHVSFQHEKMELSLETFNCHLDLKKNKLADL